MSKHHARHDLFFLNLLWRGVFSVDPAGRAWRHRVFRGGKWRTLRRVRAAGSRTFDGYLRVNIHIAKKVYTIGIHRLVWLASGRPLSPAQEINHLNGVRDDNRLENLQALSPGDNQRHCYRVLGRSVAGEANGRHRLTVADVLEARSLQAAGASYESLAHRFGVSRSTIYSAVRGLTWAGGSAGCGGEWKARPEG